MTINNIRGADYYEIYLQYVTDNNVGTLIGGHLDCTSVDVDRLKQSLRSIHLSYIETPLTKV